MMSCERIIICQFVPFPRHFGFLQLSKSRCNNRSPEHGFCFQKLGAAQLYLHQAMWKFFGKYRLMIGFRKLLVVQIIIKFLLT